MERPAILNRSRPSRAGATIRVLPARVVAKAFQRDIASRGRTTIYIFARKDTSWKAVCPETFGLLLMLRTDCSLFILNIAHSLHLLPRTPQGRFASRLRACVLRISPGLPGGPQVALTPV